jgi:Zn-dependent peptidase ImmA (M78 family)
LGLLVAVPLERKRLILQKIFSSAGLDARRCAELIGFNPETFSRWVSGEIPMPESVQPMVSAVLSIQPSLLSASARTVRGMSDADVTPQIWFKFRGAELITEDREYVVLIRQVGHFLNELEDLTGQRSLQWKTVFDSIRSGIDMQAPPREQGKEAARLFRQSTGLVHGATGSGEVLRGLLRSMGVLMFETPVKESRIEGCCFYVGAPNSARPCVFANTHHTTWFRRNLVLMHEVGHSIFESFAGAALDFFGSSNTDSDIEVRANAFAQHVLVPKEVLAHAARGIRWNSLQASDLARLVAILHVEANMVLAAAADAGFLDSEASSRAAALDVASELRAISMHALSTDEYIDRIGTDKADWIGKRTTTLTPIRLRLPIGYVQTVYDAYADRLISPGKAAEYLMVDEPEFLQRFGDIYEEAEV